MSHKVQGGTGTDYHLIIYYLNSRLINSLFLEGLDIWVVGRHGNRDDKIFRRGNDGGNDGKSNGFKWHESDVASIPVISSHHQRGDALP